MTPSDLLGITCIAVIVILGVAGAMLMDRITQELFRRHRAYWTSVGAPGGWFWRPDGRGWIENQMITRRFWVERQFSFSGLAEIDAQLQSHYRLFVALQAAGFALPLVALTTLVIINRQAAV